MAKTTRKANNPEIVLSPSRDIPFNKLVLSQANVRRVKAGVSLEELADDIARRGLLQGLSVRPIRRADGSETGMYEVPAGGRRLRALELLVRGKRLPKTAPVPCIVREEGFAEEDSLAENVQRAPLHPLDQFRAFQALRERGQPEEEIAAAFFVPVSVVRQRLKLASVSPKLLDAYAADELTLDQLMAFTVCDDHERQEAVFARVADTYDRQPYAIRRLLTEHAVRASDKRVAFVGLDAYLAAGGGVMRDLFQADDGGWLTDVALLDRLVRERLEEAAAIVAAEGWRWTEVAVSHPYGHTFGLRRLRGEVAPLTREEIAARDALLAEQARLEDEHAGGEDLPEDVDARLSEIETALAAFESRPLRFDEADVARAGAFVGIDQDGALRIERGYVRPEDEPAAVAPEPEPCASGPDTPNEGGRAVPASAGSGDASVYGAPADGEPEEDEALGPLPDRLVAELTAYRTVALRAALAEAPVLAHLAALHALVLKVFYRYALDSCLEFDLKSTGFAVQPVGLSDSPPAKALDAAGAHWREALPNRPEDLWTALVGLDEQSRHRLFAYCVASSVNAVVDPYNRRTRALAHADALAATLDLDLAALGWSPTVESFLGRVTKARIHAAVLEARGEEHAARLAAMRKGEMAEAAEALLAGTGWLPEPLRTPGRSATSASGEAAAEAPYADEAGYGDADSGTPPAVTTE